MHPQRIMLMTPAMLGMLVQILSLLTFVAWVTPSFPAGGAVPFDDKNYELTEWMATILSWANLAIFGIAFVLVGAGRPSFPIGWVRRLFIALLAMVPLLSAALVAGIYSETFEAFAYSSNIFWPGATTWLTLAIAIVLISTNLLAGFVVKLLPSEQANEPATKPSAASVG